MLLVLAFPLELEESDGCYPIATERIEKSCAISMRAMCHVCGSELTQPVRGQCQKYRQPFCVECRTKEISSVSDGQEIAVLCCNFCSQKNENETSGPDSMSPPHLISPVSLQPMETVNEAMKASQMMANPETGYIDIDQPGSFTLPLPTGEADRSSPVTLANHEDIQGEKLSLKDNTANDVQPTRAGDASSGADSASDNLNQSQVSLKERAELLQPFSIETDPCIWQLPDPEEKEDDIECSVAYNEDDDEYTDGIEWVQSSSLGSIDEECGSSNRFKEEREKAMLEVMNGRFKTFVDQLLTSEGLDSMEDTCDNWRDIIVSLSWEAATLVKSDATEGRAMDPGFQVIRGLVFKKNAAHKHMPTKYKNPRLLLLQGVLGQRAEGLSSFDSMEQEKDYVKSVIEMIDMCKPNVVLVEKNVTRDMQECLLAKEITLVFDMKLPRLERIARYTGSQIVSSLDSSMDPKLKKCDSFHIEKFVEEHNNASEGGKQLSKTLMFFEGCPKRLGCTIFLRGAHSDELKKVKFVVQQSVFLAYHLILETSFLVDQRAVFSSFQTENVFQTDKESPFSSCSSSVSSNSGVPDGASTVVSSLHGPDISVSNDFHVASKKVGSPRSTWLDCAAMSIPSVAVSNVDSFENSIERRPPSCKTMNNSEFQNVETSQEPQITPDLTEQSFLSPSTSIRGDLGESFPHVPSDPHQSISLCVGFRDQENQSQVLFSLSPSLEALDDRIESTGGGVDQGKSHDGILEGQEARFVSPNSESSADLCGIVNPKEVQQTNKSQGKTMLDNQCILVYLSSRRVLKGTVCKQHHLFRIRFYGDRDISLGQFFLHYLLNQKHYCSECGEPPEAHVYSYTHQNGKLTAHVKRFPPGSVLPGEAEGKLWMWNLCLKCEQENGILKPTRRVVMSSAAHGLSLGKFLELVFSEQSASNTLSSCGHLLHRDCLQFYGLGSTVVMLKFSSVDIYTANMPPPVLEFNNPNGQEWLHNEAKDVLEKGHLLFMEVMNSLQKIVSKISLSKQPTDLSSALKELSEIEEMLKQEKSEFEASLHKAINKKGKLGQTVHQILSLNRLNHELLLELYIWDRRLRALGLTSGGNNGIQNDIHEKQLQVQKDDMVGRGIGYAGAAENTEEIHDDPTDVGPMKIKEPSSSDEFLQTGNPGNTEVGLKPMLAEPSLSDENAVRNIQVLQSSLPNAVYSTDSGSGIHNSGNANSSKMLSEERVEGLSSTPRDQSPLINGSQTDEAIPNMAEITQQSIFVTDVNPNTETVEISMPSKVSANSFMDSCLDSLPVNLEDSEDWVWKPFSETRRAYRKDLQRGFSQKFEFINSYTPAYLSTVNQLITQEKSRLHFPIDSEENVVSVYEEEFSSIIACAVAVLQDRYSSGENVSERGIRNEKEGEFEKSIETPYGSFSDFSIASHQFSFNGSLDLDGILSFQNFSSDESSSGSDGFFVADTLLSSKSLHPEIPLGAGKLPGKSKYSVICIYAKQFYALRRSCCPSELDYISSLSRCKKWDAQGGKSGVFFAKTLDDRFIVKQVKKTELDSFLKFAPEYFKHISHSLSSRSQTCLAKILGIYQVIIRQSKSSKEVKIDLMVMENLFFGRNISRMYDLKGAHHRFASDANGTRKVLLDQNFMDDMIVSPFYVSGKTKHLLQRAIWNDTSFLTSINVMDYSLLLGVDKERQELVFGIIDYLRQYTWDKHLETWVKASLVVPRNELPTVVSPKEYKKRFRNFMSTHFLIVPPDCWCSDSVSGSCKYCRNGSDESLNAVHRCSASKTEPELYLPPRFLPI
ncbi:hypothetical protein ACLOJK_001088 [Asimina triloba]